MSETTLRERTRARRRAAIEQAALRLFAERGYDSTTLAQVAEEAEVAPRTVSMYFPSKLHLALAHSTDAAERLAEALEQREPRTPAVSTITDWLAEEFSARGEEVELTSAMQRANPEIRGAETPELAAAMARVVAALATDLGRAADDPVVAIAGGAVKGVLEALAQLGPADAGSAGAFETATTVLDAVVAVARAG
jgi:AcrR family transcriptional regulator